MLSILTLKKGLLAAIESVCWFENGEESGVIQ
jgi:hypothetical protein